MSCCTPIVKTFNDAIVTEEYTAAMRAVYGDLPKLSVYYLVDGEYVISGIFTQIQFSGTAIMVDNGGVARGILKIS